MSVQLPPAPEFGAPLAPAPSPEVLAFLARRRSASALNLTTPGPDAQAIEDLLGLAVRAPDHGKLAPWRFIVLEGTAKASFAARLDALALARGDPKAQAKLGKLKAPPLAIAVVSSPQEGNIPEWEQVLSAGAVCTNLLYAALAMGFGANWITDWYAYDPEATALLGLASHERIAGFILIGAPAEPPLERERPNLTKLVSWLRS